MEYLHGEYRETRPLAKTQMSRVFLATSTKRPGTWLVKQIFKTSDTNMNSSLMAEPEILVKVQHHALPVIIDVFEDESSIYVVREYIPGDTLQKRLSDRGIVPEAEARGYFAQLCAVFSYLHQVKPHPIIYKDCKPANIILDDTGHLYLIDFGIAKGSPDSEIRGATKGFAAPEQYDKNANTDERTDVYGLGATMYYLLTGKIPNQAATLQQSGNPAPKMSEGMGKILMKCLQEAPEGRYQSMAELRKDLEDIDKITSEYKARKLRKNINIIVSIVFMTVFALIGTTGAIQWQIENEKKYQGYIQEGKGLIERNDLPGAEGMFAKAVDMMPGRPEGYVELGDLYNMRRDYGKSLQLLLDAEGNQSNLALDASFQYCIGTAYYYMPDYEAALAYFQKAVGLDPLVIKYQRDLAVCYASLGMYDDADDILQKIRDESFSEAYVLAQVYEHQGRLEEAIGQYTSCFATPDLDLRANAYVAAAMIYEKNPELPNALDKLIGILEKAERERLPQRRIVMLDLLGASYLQKAGKSTGEERERCLGLALGKYLTLKNEFIGGLDTYIHVADIYQQLGSFDESAQVLDEALTVFGRNYKVVFRYAILELAIQSRLPEEERDYGQFKEYAKEAMDLAQEENEETEILKSHL